MYETKTKYQKFHSRGTKQNVYFLLSLLSSGQVNCYCILYTSGPSSIFQDDLTTGIACNAAVTLHQHDSNFKMFWLDFYFDDNKYGNYSIHIFHFFFVRTKMWHFHDDHLPALPAIFPLSIVPWQDFTILIVSIMGEEIQSNINIDEAHQSLFCFRCKRTSENQ